MHIRRPIAVTEIALYLRAEQHLHDVAGELRFEFPDGPFWVAWEASQRGHDAGLRPCSFKHHRVVNLDLIEMVEFRLEELTTLVDGRVDQRVAVMCKWHLWPIGLEKVLIDMKSRPERFEGRFQPLDRELLSGLVKALEVHSADLEDHAKVAALGEEGRFIPEAVEVDVRVERTGLSPRLDDFGES
jgi:hypothetical protein